MSQLYKIGLQNFRVFKEMTEFELAPLTILTGANSSGKSSLFKALLLIGNNVESNSFFKLDFTGTQHNLGSFKDALNKKCGEEKITLRFHLSYPFQSIRKYPVPTGRKLSNIYLSTDTDSQTYLILEVSYKEDNNNGLLSNMTIYVQDEKNKSILISADVADEKTEENHRFSINLKWFAKNYELIENSRRAPFRREKIDINNNFSESDIKTFNIPNSRNVSATNRTNRKFSIEGKDDIGYIFDYFFNNQSDFILKKEIDKIGFQNNRINYPPGRELMLIERFVRYDLLREAGYHFENTEYVEAVRAKSRRIYTHDSQATLFDELLLDYSAVKLEAQADAFIKKWIREFEIADDVRFEPINGVATLVNLVKDGISYPLADLGYGVTQYLPLLLKIALQITTRKGRVREEKPLKKTIILEEPETNLHPKLQSKLADMLLDALENFEVKFIVETHSEYIIRRLQILTAEKYVTPSNIALYYFYEPNKVPQGKSQVERINILQDGNLDNDFGDGFFDEATKMKYELLRLKTKKK